LHIHNSINWKAAIYAGLVAGIVATMAQLILWWVFWDVLPEILYRDARLAAAIVMGRGVLPPPASFDWWVMAVATLIHFALSVFYSLILAGLVSRRSTPAASLIGILFGMALFLINMYGFTFVFPWFAAARDWITFLTHIVFGLCAAASYKLLSARRSALF
jgi:hypothetical protein